MVTEFKGDYAFLSNMWDAPIAYAGLMFPNNECAFQATKNLEKAHLFTHLTGGEAKKLGREVELRKDWEDVKDSLMERICRAKFEQHKDLRKMLMAIDGEIQEGNNWGDTYWGVCNGKGENRLGKILMMLRDEYRIWYRREMLPMIQFKNIFKITKEEAENAEIWLIARSKKMFDNSKLTFPVIHVPELSPSHSLLSKYQQLKGEGNWNHHSFLEIYVPQFLEEMKTPAAKKWLNLLYNESKSKNIICCCYCHEENTCHRSIIAGLLQGVGANVDPDMADYSLFYKAYTGNTGDTVCFTGHRPKDLYGYNRASYTAIVECTKNVVLDLYRKGYRTFISGGAQGFDQLAFWAVHACKKTYPNIKNVLYIPFFGQEKPWLQKGAFSQEDYAKMIKCADEIQYITKEPVVGGYQGVVKAMYKRNHAMVDASEVVIGLYPDKSWETTEKGGTAECLKYAKEKDKKIIQVCYNPENCTQMPTVM